jgi:hypothetical protein
VSITAGKHFTRAPDVKIGFWSLGKIGRIAGCFIRGGTVVIGRLWGFFAHQPRKRRYLFKA